MHSDVGTFGRSYSKLLKVTYKMLLKVFWVLMLRFRLFPTLSTAILKCFVKDAKKVSLYSSSSFFIFVIFVIFLTAFFLHDIHCTSFVQTSINAKIVRFSHAAAIEIKI